MKTPLYLASIWLLSAMLAGCDSKGEVVVEHVHWEYEAPEWQNEGYADCGGTVQSPVNISTSATIKAALPDISFAYTNFPMTIVDNGHTVQVTASGNNAITVDGVTFTLKQFHFHHHSEHAINGTTAPLELHMVHQDGATGNLAVVGVMLQEGAKNDLIEKVWSAIPSTKSTTVTTTTQLDMNEVLPFGRKYYTYTGSLTTPPCSQGLKWIVLKDPITVSAAQIEAFATLYENNARPLQSLNNRYVLEQQ